MFRVIGHYEIFPEGDLVRVRSAAEFNLEAARQYALDMREAIRGMPARFGTLVSFEAPPVIGPEVEEAMRVSARERAQRGMVAVAFVTASLEGIALARTQWERIYEGSGIALEFFQDEAAAADWLRARIASA